MALILPFKGIHPIIADDAFIAANATVIGDTVIGAGSSVWFGAIIRGDVNTVRIGARSNIQDGTIIHVSRLRSGTVIGDDVSIGHQALIHACTLETGCFIGMNAVVMDDVVVESGAMVAAGAMVTPGKRVLRGQLWAGRPAKLLRLLSDDDLEMMVGTTRAYTALAQTYRADMG